MNFTATFHVFNIQGYSQEKLKKTPMWPQNTGHKPNGTTYKDSFFDSDGLIL